MQAHGDPKNASELMEEVYGELRNLAAARMAREPTGHTLQPTALVNEAWLRITKNKDQKWANRAHFFAAAAAAMQRILVENARRRAATKRGGGLQRVDLDSKIQMAEVNDDQILQLNEALEKLTKIHPRPAKVVVLLYFGGLSHAEAAESMDVTERTIGRDWEFARTWLYRQIHPE